MPAPTQFVFLLLFILNSLLNAQSTDATFDAFYANYLQGRLTNLGISEGYKGLSAAVLVPGQGIWSGTYGNSEPNETLTPNMRLGMASNSKAVTAGLILRLQDEGFFDLDDPIGNYLSTYEHVDSTITIRQLLTHTTGLFDFINDWTSATSNEYSNNPNRLWSLDQLIATIGPAESAAGLRYSYSNTNFLLLGKLAEVVTGESVRDLLHEYLFTPHQLGLRYPPYDNVFSGSWGNLWNSSGNSVSLSTFNQRGFLSFPATAGSVWSTPYEMVRWYDLLFGDELLSPASQQDLRDNDGAIAYGMGIRLRNTADRSIYYHAGAWGYRSYLIHDPSTGIALCLVSNQYGTSVGNAALALFEDVLAQRPANRNDIELLSPIPSGRSCNPAALFCIIKNAGTNAIQNANLDVKIDGQDQLTVPLDLGGELASGGQQFVSVDFDFSPWADGLTHQMELTTTLLDTIEQAVANNYRQTSFAIHADDAGVLSTPYQQDFEDSLALPADFITAQSSNILDWKPTTYAAATGKHSLARINYHDARIGQFYRFELPPLQLGDLAQSLSFAYAHANYPSVGREDLKGFISTDCGFTYVPLFELIGNDLATATATTDWFLPAADEWQRFTVDLGDYANETVIIRFELENQFGNHTFLDDIAIEATTQTRDPLGATTINVWPNPARDHFQLSTPAGTPLASVRLHNQLGQLVREFSPAQRHFSLRNQRIPAGLYQLRCVDQAGNRYVHPLVIE
ncbi:MAG: serine hydrolase [Bacteroidota bacterium]